MLIRSLNLISPSPENKVYNISVNDSGTMIIAENIDPLAIGIRSIQLSSIFTLYVDSDGDVKLADREFSTSPAYSPLWFESPTGIKYKVSTTSSGDLDISEAPYERQQGTPFYVIYCNFLSRITDDLYLEWTPEDTFKNLESIFLNALTGFEFPKFPLWGYSLNSIGMVDAQGSVISYGKFTVDLTLEEINIITDLMIIEWIGRQISTVNMTRMKYSSRDFQLTSQANHLAKLLETKNQYQLSNKRAQRLYQRRTIDSQGKVTPNYWSLSISSTTQRWRLAYSGTGWLYGSPIIGGAWWTESLSSIYGGYSVADPFTEAYTSGLGGAGPLINPRDVII